MAISRDLKITVSGKTAKIDKGVYLYMGDKNVDLYFELIDADYRYDRVSNGNILRLIEGEGVVAEIKMVKPNNEEISIPNVPITNGRVKLTVTEDLCDDFDEVGVYKLQFLIQDGLGSQRHIPPVDFEIVEPIFISGATSAMADKSRVGKAKVASEKKSTYRVGLMANGDYVVTNWATGDLITADKLNNIEAKLKSLDTFAKDKESDIAKVEVLENGIAELGSQMETNAKFKNGIIGDFLLRLQSNDVENIKLIGDSITYGVGGSNSGDGVNPNGNLIFQDTDGTKYGESPTDVYCWANMFRGYINSNFPNVNFFNAGIGGKSSKFANSKKHLWVNEVEDVVFVMLGTNDRWDCLNTSEFETNLTSFLSYVNSRAKTMIVMTATPTTNDNLSNTPSFNFGIREVDRIITKVCTKYNYAHISFYREFLNYLKVTNTKKTDYLQNPGSHPINAGYDVMWQLLQQKLGLIDDDYTKWNDFTKPIESIKVLTDMTKVTSVTPLTQKDGSNELFNYKCITTVAFTQNYAISNGFPNFAGVLKTFRLSSAQDDYSWQEYQTYHQNTYYRRYWNSSTSTWSSFTLFTGGTSIENQTITGFTIQAGKTIRKAITLSNIINPNFSLLVTAKSFIVDGVIWSYTKASSTMIYINFYNANTSDVTLSDLIFSFKQFE